jgi:soluble lytic murein transglycosylase-like protein
MPFWVRELGEPGHNLFQERVNLRYGCTILRHYLDIERGDLTRALARYNGTLGKSRYPEEVLRAWSGTWNYEASRPSIIIAPTRYLGDG